jgi:hypothetical protein
MGFEEQYHELIFYTLSQQDSYFIHQHAVDAFAAQTATEQTKPITIVYGLAGLYLFAEKGFTGKEIQNAHVNMSKQSKSFPLIHLPQKRGTITIKNVLDAPEGEARNEMIKRWCRDVWRAYETEQEKIKLFTDKLLFL